MKEPTMIYASSGDSGGVKSQYPIVAEGGIPTDEYYWHKVVDADEVEACLKDGWYKTPGDLPKKRKRGPNKPKIEHASEFEGIETNAEADK
jgi:hypothetical protein